MKNNYLKHRFATQTINFDRQFTEHNKTTDNIRNIFINKRV